MFDHYFAVDVIDHSSFPDQASGRGDFVVTRDLWNGMIQEEWSKGWEWLE